MEMDLAGIYVFFLLCVVGAAATPLILLLLLLVPTGVVATVQSQSQSQSAPFFVNCGSNSSPVSAAGRSWVGDGTSSAGAGVNFTLSSLGHSVASSPTSNSTATDASTYGPLYRTARIFNKTSKYMFNVSAGSYYVRLHFCLLSFQTSASAFDVAANGLKLFSKYNNITEEISAKNSSLHAASHGNSTAVTWLVKEYFLNISSNELGVLFRPASGSFAFVNAIEVVPILDTLFFDSAAKVGCEGAASRLKLLDRGLETMYRLNVGGPEIEPTQDPGLWRKWESDDTYIVVAGADSVLTNRSSISYANPNDSSLAPLLLYQNARITTNNDLVDKRFNMSWRFHVDTGFEYVVRLHFCELQYNRSSQRIFKIYINYRSAARNYDVFARGGRQMNKAYHDDFLDSSLQHNGLLLQLGPDSSSSISGTYALLNGLEIFKLSRNRNLAGASPKIGAGGIGKTHKSDKGKNKFVAVGSSLVSLLIVSGIGVAFLHCRSRKKKGKHVKDIPPGWRPLVIHDATGSTTDARVARSPSSAAGFMASSRIGRRFMLAEIRAATKNFDESLIIGTGGFGKVYKGEVEDGSVVAIKRANPQSQQGLAEFETEIEMLSKLRHRHLVSMMGYCDEQMEMILVYEYMANGTLRSHLFGTELPPLPWKQRLDICIGAARGLHYLHTGADRGIIHRDVKTTNILLDDNFVAKMADFGLSKTGPALDHTHVSTAVKGSFGYLDPEYYRRQQLTQKSDVYSFGVVLFEVLCARPVINPTLPKDQINLAEWALQWQQQGELEAIVDPRLEGRYSVGSLNKFGEIAGKCLADEGKNRPTMGNVLWHLEYALQLHEAYTSCEEGASSRELRLSDLPPCLPHINEVDSCPESATAEERSMLPKIWADQFPEDSIEAENSQAATFPRLRS